MFKFVSFIRQLYKSSCDNPDYTYTVDFVTLKALAQQSACPAFSSQDYTVQAEAKTQETRRVKRRFGKGKL